MAPMPSKLLFVVNVVVGFFNCTKCDIFKIIMRERERELNFYIFNELTFRYRYTCKSLLDMWLGYL